LEDADCQKAIEAISDKLIRCVTEDVGDKTRRELKNDLSGALGSDIIIGDEIALGDFSIMYKAKRKKIPVVVKAALPSIRHDWIADDFKSRADWFQQFGESPFINIIEAVREDRVSCAIMEYVPLPTLREVTGLKPKEVAAVLAQVALATDRLHKKAMKTSQTVRLIGPLRPSHIFHNSNDGEVKISPLDMSNATLQSCNSRPLLKLSENELTSLAPERCAGERFSFKTDQYYIGLLGLELMTGEPPVQVNCYADLLKKEAFFDAPLAKFQKYREASPELLFVLGRMLERQPENRWPSMSEVYECFSRIAQGKLPTGLRNNAIATHDELELKYPTFYSDFYQNFFRRSPRAKAFFKDTNWEVQCQKLKEAIGVLLNFRPEDVRNPGMSVYAKLHHTRGIQSEYFLAFREAFIDTLNNAKVDNYGVDAWRAILNAGIVYMTGSLKQPSVRRAKGGAAAPKTPARPRSRPNKSRRGGH
jgi:hypothetical protein